MTNSEEFKEYEQKFCSVPANANEQARIVFIVSVVVPDPLDDFAYINWISPVNPTRILSWPTNIVGARLSLKIIC